MNPIKAAVKAYKTRVSWLGESGQPVARELAQQRANICNSCENNKPIPLGDVAADVAAAAMGFISLKNEMNLRVDGEVKLHFCSACWCSLRTKVWVPLKHVESTTDFEELPPHCWIKIEAKK